MSTNTSQEALLRACRCAAVAEDYKGKKTIVLDLRGVTPIFDFFVITTGTVRRQMHAIAEEVDRVMKQEGSRKSGLEGYQESSWILQDYGDIVLHIFSPQKREMYDLEGLWADARRVNWHAELGLPEPVETADDEDAVPPAYADDSEEE